MADNLSPTGTSSATTTPSFNGNHNPDPAVVQEKPAPSRPGGPMALLGLALTAVIILGIVLLGVFEPPLFGLGIAAGVISLIAIMIGIFAGLKVLKPSEARVLILFGEYYGTLKGPGFYWTNPFTSMYNPAATTQLGQSRDVSKPDVDSDLNTVELLADRAISLKFMTLDNNLQKVNDYHGNPIEIGVAVIWRVVDTAKAVFNVDDFKKYLSLQCDSAIRDIVRLYPYDKSPDTEIDTDGDGQADENSLRGSSMLVAERIREQIGKKVEIAGLVIEEARITHLSYAPEIAGAMLQRQQASAVVDARRTIVDGAVGMVELALAEIEANDMVFLDEERKAQMVSNLLVVLCSNNDVAPVINTGTLYG